MSAPTTVSISDFKARCLKLLTDVEKTGQPLLVTRRGKAIARVVALEEPQSLLGSVRYADEAALLAPVDDQWNAAT
ncbi:MAG: prevent-host-death family protein [Myxococcota bacterium]|jgi:prevent-host-death family protein